VREKKVSGIGVNIDIDFTGKINLLIKYQFDNGAYLHEIDCFATKQALLDSL
jgi:hypothetical protein